MGDLVMTPKPEGGVHMVLGPGVEYEELPVNNPALSDEFFRFRFSTSGKQRLDANYLKVLSRAIYKILLGLAYLNRGKDFALDSQFDELRQIILGKRQFHGFLLLNERGVPSARVTTTYDLQGTHSDGSLRIPIFFDVFGLQFMTEVIKRLPPSDPPPGWSLIKF
jgi:hypothetical protein